MSGNTVKAGATVEPLRTERRMQRVVLWLVLVLLLLLAWQGFRLSALERPEQVLPAADSLAINQIFTPEAITREQSAAMRERPLFWASRRPAVSTQKQPSEGQDKVGEIDGIRLVGVIGSGKSAAIIVTVKGSAKKRLAVGQKVNGWRLERVAGNEAVMRAGARSKTLVLGKSSPGKPAKTRKRPRRSS